MDLTVVGDDHISDRFDQDAIRRLFRSIIRRRGCWSCNEFNLYGLLLMMALVPQGTSSALPIASHRFRRILRNAKYSWSGMPWMAGRLVAISPLMLILWILSSSDAIVKTSWSRLSSWMDSGTFPCAVDLPHPFQQLYHSPGFLPADGEIGIQFV